MATASQMSVNVLGSWDHGNNEDFETFLVVVKFLDISGLESISLPCPVEFPFVLGLGASNISRMRNELGGDVISAVEI
jgi:hypothetical protein